MIQYELEETAGFLIYRVGRLLRFKAAQFFRERNLEITPEQWVLLLQIAEKEQPLISDLVDKTANDHPNVTRLLKGLSNQGYVSRTVNPEDRRCQHVSVSEAGQALIDEILIDLISEKAVYFEGLDQNDVATLNRILKIVLGNLEGR
ncbi:MarR family transcriptional regulator [Pseudodesulfovibrio sp. zrk46]|uniref:MarR family winged helix-turn-helix transcriptional regulator n=1 Tax=Pseudodesulfovibrio sp. zrk46 TaxID=2725288 RepID=UPI0014496C4A|nr:MarR family transcriptional regulator [Pseudodesulfovibrio sp. zrk46]QJB58192.1 MarR family transcriptional regulator [Pseudodesulfovibrio sp. zrk46]